MTSSVRVAVRVRPLTEQEQQNCQHHVISYIPDNQQQIMVNGDRPFTFDHVFPPTITQQELYSTCVIPLLNKFIEGYNSTILAYGQTGSGKTYSMGIGMNSTIDEGIVPRFIHSLFETLELKKSSPTYSFQVCVSFLELHNEDLVDLLNQGSVNLTIREDTQGNICWAGVKEESVNNPTELMAMLQKGSIARTTASTDMNSTSSRSHAIFSVILKQQDTEKKLISKFHFVDLAGSERLKRTNAVGDRAKEGISINSGLLALGNVISALGDESRRVSHIPYRDSKLTRLLQDSLGGNSQTLMIACASPAQYNLPETLNTLKYANRARNIRNRVVVNQEMNESERLKSIISRLKEELRGSDEFLRAVNDEMDSLKMQVGSLSYTLNETVRELAAVKYERDMFRSQLSNEQLDAVDENSALLKEYATTIELLKAELTQAQQQQREQITVSHVDSSMTLVGYEPDRKKKRHRVGSKRSKSGRQRTVSIDDNVLYEARKSIGKETVFLESAKISMMRPDPPIHDKMDIWTDRRRTIDVIPIGGVLETDHINENKSLLQKLTKMIESKHLIIRQLERSEKLRIDQVKQLNRKVQDLTSKKTAATAQYKRDMIDMQNQYECRLKKLQVEQQTLRRKHMQLIQKSDQARHQHQSAIDQLKRNVDKLTHEKKKMLKRLKLESDRAKSKHLEHEKDMSKLKRQEAQLVIQKKRIERELCQQKSMHKRSTEEIVALSGQMKQIAAILKKISPAKDLMGKSLVAKALACANVRGYLSSRQNGVKKSGGKLKVTSLQQHVHQKKKMIHKAISVYVKGQSATEIRQELVQKRERLLEEQKELLEERQLVIDEENKSGHVNAEDPQYMDERIDLITLQLDTLTQQIQRLNDDTTETDEGDWMDVELVLDDTDSLLAYETALSLIRSLEPEEARLVAESLMEDLISIKTQHQKNTTMTRHLNYIVYSLQTTLVQMRRLKAPRPIDTGLLSPMDNVLLKMLSSPVDIKCGLVLPK